MPERTVLGLGTSGLDHAGSLSNGIIDINQSNLQELTYNPSMQMLSINLLCDVDR